MYAAQSTRRQGQAVIAILACFETKNDIYVSASLASLAKFDICENTSMTNTKMTLASVDFKKIPTGYLRIVFYI